VEGQGDKERERRRGALPISGEHDGPSDRGREKRLDRGRKGGRAWVFLGSSVVVARLVIRGL